MNLEPKYQKLFLADDDQDDQLIFKEAEIDIDSSIVIETAFDGKHALTRLEAMETLPDLIFLEINMPLMDGFECLSELKSLAKMSNTPVIIYSTSQSPMMLEKAERLGADAFLAKPTDHEKLEANLAKIFSTNFSIPSKGIRIFSS